MPVTLQESDLEAIGSWMASNGLRILLILVGAYVGYRLFSRLVRILTERLKLVDEEDNSVMDKRIDTISSIVRTSGLVVIGGVALALVLQELGIDLGPLLAGVGIVGLALGLGAQSLVKDVISGIFILLENLYLVGEVVQLQGITGTVESVTLRTTTLRDFYGTVHTMPNGDIRNVANMMRDWSRAIVDVRIAYDADVDQAVNVLTAAGQSMQDDPAYAPLLLEEPTVTGVESIDDNQVTLRLIVKTAPGQHYGVQRYLRHYIKERLETVAPRQAVQIIESNEPRKD